MLVICDANLFQGVRLDIRPMNAYAATEFMNLHGAYDCKKTSTEAPLWHRDFRKPLAKEASYFHGLIDVAAFRIEAYPS